MPRALPGFPERVCSVYVQRAQGRVLPADAAAAGRRDHARPAVGRGDARLHARLPLLPGRHDQPPGAREARAAGGRGGAARAAGHRPRGGLAHLAVDDGPHADRRAGERARRPAVPDARAALAALDAPRQRARPTWRSASRRRRRAASRWRPRPAASACATSSTRTTPRTSCCTRCGPPPREGYTGAKLYFMCGLPTETDDDLRAILDLGHRAWQAARETGNRGLPRHGERLAARAQAAHAVRVGGAGRTRRSSTAGSACCARRCRASPITLKYRDAETSLLEGVFTRGDRRLGASIEDAYRRGCRFDAWTRAPALRHVARRVRRARHRSRALPARALDGPRPAVGHRAVPGHAQVPRAREAARRPGGRHRRLPARGRLLLVRRRRVSAATVGAQPHASLDLERALAAVPAPTFGRRARAAGRRRVGSRGTCTRFRIRFEKGERDALHLAPGSHAHLGADACAAPGCRSRFTQGHHPHLKMSFGPPLPLGYRSRAEVFDLEFSRPPGVDLAERLDAVLPDGLRVSASGPFSSRPLRS